MVSGKIKYGESHTSVQTTNREQNYLLMNVNLDSIAPIGSALRSIDSLVDMLDTKEIEKSYDLKASQGTEPIHPKTFIKLALWAIHNCRFSLRKMEEDTENNLSYKWLTGGMVIDHSTIGKFFSVHPVPLADLLAQVVLIGVEKELVNFDLLGVDTVKIRANASYKQFRNQDGINREKIKIRERIKNILENASKEQAVIEQKELEILAMREMRLEEAQMELSKREKEREKEGLKINMTDFDCQMVQQGNGEKNPGYPITVAVDSQSDFITGLKIDEYGNDARNLFPTLEESENNGGKQHEQIVADPGFASMENLERLEAEGRNALIPDKRMDVEKRDVTAKGEYDRSKFKYMEGTDRYRCPEGRMLEKKAEVEQSGRMYNRYSNSQACSDCTKTRECTDGAFRTIKKRAHMAECPFGQIKHNLKYRIFMRRGQEKIRMEMSLLCMLHDLLKIGQVEYGYMTG
jgi:transposase